MPAGTATRGRGTHPPGTDLRHFDRRWLPEGLRPDPEPRPSRLRRSRTPSPRRASRSPTCSPRSRASSTGGCPRPSGSGPRSASCVARTATSTSTLTERNERGDVLAQCQGGHLEEPGRPASPPSSSEATGEGLKTDIKILCLARVRFDPLFGLDLIIEDVDPSYTLGDLAAKLARIRERLVEERPLRAEPGPPRPRRVRPGRRHQPRDLGGPGRLPPGDRPAPATPGSASSVFFGATFQGLDAPSSIRTAVNEALAAHRQRPFDALVIIRGGGSVTDLAWLNDLELARLVCRSPIPVFTGIGHERDNTILDEIAHRRFDTPSKVALHITTTIKDNALAAVTAFEQIKLQVARILTRERTALATRPIGSSGVGRLTGRVRPESSWSLSARPPLPAPGRADGDRPGRAIKTASVGRPAGRTTRSSWRRSARRQYQLREATQALEAGYVRLIGTADQTLCEASLGLKQAMRGDRPPLRAATRRAEGGDREGGARHRLAGRRRRSRRRAVTSTTRRPRWAGMRQRWSRRPPTDLECDLDARSPEGRPRSVEAARREIEAFARLVVGLGPQATLRRGFTIARDAEDRPDHQPGGGDEERRVRRPVPRRDRAGRQPGLRGGR